MSDLVPSPPATAAAPRIDAIARARQTLLQQRAPAGLGLVDPWIERSWQRCLAIGHEPQHRVGFDTLSVAQVRRAREASHALTAAARPVLEELGRALADTRYFAILTDARGVVVDVHGPVDRRDRRSDLITRIGVDLSEPSVGTTAIGAALTELQPVWLHRGEHFFDDTSCYSCAGAPLFGAAGECVGMLDLTGVDVPERPELRHLVAQTARSIENQLALRQTHALLLRLNWPGHRLGEDTDGLVGLDADGHVCTANSAARQMLPALSLRLHTDGQWAHASELFAVPVGLLFDAAQQAGEVIELPLWSGLRLQAVARRGDEASAVRVGGTTASGDSRRLKDIETALIRKAVEDARGNVAQAAVRLGVSRATIYRKLGLQRR